MCFVRMRQNNSIVLTTYGRASGFCIDPVEKKPLFHFLPGTAIFSFGTAGCNLACQFCQNWDISKARQDDVLNDTALPEDIAATAEKMHCQSVAFTYNEPIVFMEYAIETAKCCHARGIKTVAVSNGYVCQEPAREFFSHMDATNIDLKAFTEDFYKKITGSHLQPVLDTLRYVKKETSTWLEITCLLIPGENDGEAEIDAASKWIMDNLGPDVPVHYSAFFPAWKMLNKPATPKATLTRARKIAMQNGLRYVYTGNVEDTEGSNTYCHNCGKIVIERCGYAIRSYQLTSDGNCKFCDTKCAGIFTDHSGNWGAKRQPVRMNVIIND
jgi:pyruvate formate lyase activating enzyme